MLDEDELLYLKMVGCFVRFIGKVRIVKISFILIIMEYQSVQESSAHEE